MAALALSACAGTGELAGVGAADQPSTSSPLLVASTGSKPEPFNPFDDGTGSRSGARKIIKSPTVAEVLKPGPLDEITLGRADAPVTVIKYFSPTCPYCRLFQKDTFPEFKRTYIDTGKVRFVMREFPIGFQSGAATIAIRCAPADQRVALYGALLNQQSRWVSQEVRRDPIFAIARSYGVTRAAFDACYDDKALIAGLQAVKDRGRTLGIIGTPNFFINERLEKRVLIMADFKEIIDPLIADRTASR